MAGRITEWNDDKGFGFVLPSGGGVRAFVHINEFQRGSRRPVVGDLISYLPGVDAKGRARACQVRHAGQRIAVPGTPSRLPRAGLGAAALVAIVLAALAGVLPPVLAVIHVLLSAVSWHLYRSDKAAARRDARRTPEASLHLADLLGGWPGALIAQQQFRHKTAKPGFQLVFWATVLVNLAASGWLVYAGLPAGLPGAIGV